MLRLYGSTAVPWIMSRPIADRFEAHRRAGPSRGAKAAFWGGAEDQRFALVTLNESGKGGAALSRRNFGETLGRITGTFPHWFAGSYSRFSERIASLPVDQHMLLAFIAPRALSKSRAPTRISGAIRTERSSAGDVSERTVARRLERCAHPSSLRAPR